MELLGLDLAGRRVLVCGAGSAADRWVRQLRACGARVTVRHDPVPADLDEVWLVVAAGTEQQRADVQTWAQQRQRWCLTSAGDGSAREAATGEGRPLVGTIAGAGEAARAERVRDRLQELRRTGALAPAPPPDGGTVTLVGGGPGDPALLTVRGRAALAQADVVVTDRLGPAGVLRHLAPGAEVIGVGKSPGHHPVPQHEINGLLVGHAQRGRRVVRLKGGDPFVLGRGGEEVLACRAAGVPVTVVPGISSAVAVPGLAGVPVTHRDVVAAFHVTSGHAGLDRAARACVRDRSATLVILMGVSNLGMLVEQLRADGADPSLPVAIVERGSTPQQRLTQAPLAEIVAVAARARVRTPAVVVIGAVADPALLAARSGA